MIDSIEVDSHLVAKIMTRKTSVLCLENLDLKHVATILNSVFPAYSLCECARMAAEFAPKTGCECTLCTPGTYPDCVTRHKNPSNA